MLKYSKLSYLRHSKLLFVTTTKSRKYRKTKQKKNKVIESSKKLPDNSVSLKIKKNFANQRKSKVLAFNSCVS